MNTLTNFSLKQDLSPLWEGLVLLILVGLWVVATPFQAKASDPTLVNVQESKLIPALDHDVNCAAHEIQEVGSTEIYHRWGVALVKVKDRQTKWQQAKWFKGFRYKSYLKSLKEFRDLTDLLNISLQSRVTERALNVSISWPFKGSLLPVNDFLLVHPSLGYIDLDTFEQVTNLTLKVENEVLTLSTSISPLEYCAKVPLILQMNNAIFKTKD